MTPDRLTAEAERDFWKRRYETQHRTVHRLEAALRSVREQLAEATVSANAYRADRDRLREQASIEIESINGRLEVCRNQCDRFRVERDRLLWIAEHLFQMVSPEAWRDSGGDDGQGHYEGDYLAAKLREELRRFAEAQE